MHLARDSGFEGSVGIRLIIQNNVLHNPTRLKSFPQKKRKRKKKRKYCVWHETTRKFGLISKQNN